MVDGTVDERDGLVLITGRWRESYQPAEHVQSTLRDERQYVWAGLYDPWTG